MISPSLVGLVAGLCVTIGVLLAVDALRIRERSAGGQGPGPLARLALSTGLTGRDRVTVRRRRTILVAALLGLLIGVPTGWYMLVLVLPAAAVGVPYLVRPSAAAHEIERLADLDSWVRSLAGVLVGGASGLEQALRATLSSAPRTVRPALSRLVARLDAQQPIAPALRLWADEMDDHTADIVAAALILESERREGGISEALVELADNVSTQTKVRRQIEADRAGHRSTARWVTVISLVVLVLMVLTGSYIEPYRTPTGQLVALGLLGAYTGCLVWMRSISEGRKIPRFLRETGARR